MQSDFLDTSVPMNVHAVLSVLCSDGSALNSKFNTFEECMVLQSYIDFTTVSFVEARWLHYGMLE
jgi:hypothetical protein